MPLGQLKSSTLEWTLNNIRIEKIISAPIWTTNIFWRFSLYLDLRHCPKLQSCAISRKNNQPNLKKMTKKLILGSILSHLNLIWAHKDFMQVFTSTSKHCSKLSSYVIYRKTNETNLRKWQKN